MNKKTIISTAVIILFAVLIGLFIYAHPGKPFVDSKFICAYPNYPIIETGQNGKIITEIMGQADEQIIKNDISEYRFGQGDIENQIKEGWIYNYEGWDGHIEIYFDTDGTVIGKNCGNG